MKFLSQFSYHVLGLSEYISTEASVRERRVRFGGIIFVSLLQKF